MATPLNLMGLGEPAATANRVGTLVQAITCQGATRASAANIPGQQCAVYVNASNSGSGLLLPTVGGDITATGGILLGDLVSVINLQAQSIIVYAPAGSTFTGDGVSTDGAVGTSVAALRNVEFMPITASTWIAFKGSA